MSQGIVVHGLKQIVSPSLQWILYGPALIDVNKGTSVRDITKRQFLLQQLHCNARAIDPEWSYFCESGPSTNSDIKHPEVKTKNKFQAKNNEM